MQAISREALPLPATPKGVTTWATKLAFIYVKRAKAKHTVSCGPFLLKLLVTVKIMYKKKVFQM